MQKLNNNCLEGYRCPKCNSQGTFGVRTQVWMSWDDSGVEEADEGIEPECDFDEEHAVFVCHHCGHSGAAPEFNAEKHFVLRGGNHCVVCGATEEHLETRESVQIDGPDAWEVVECMKCSAVFKPLLQLTGVEILFTPEEVPDAER